MGGTHRNAQFFRYEKRYCSCGFGAHPFQWSHFGDAGAHGLHDLPSPAERSQGNGGKTGQGNPHIMIHKLSEADVDAFAVLVKDHGRPDDAHYFLGVISAMSEAE